MNWKRVLDRNRITVALRKMLAWKVPLQNILRKKGNILTKGAGIRIRNVCSRAQRRENENVHNIFFHLNDLETLSLFSHGGGENEIKNGWISRSIRSLISSVRMTFYTGVGGGKRKDGSIIRITDRISSRWVGGWCVGTRQKLTNSDASSRMSRIQKTSRNCALLHTIICRTPRSTVVSHKNSHRISGNFGEYLSKF